MPARTHTRTHRPATDTVEVRLPWWAVALPALAFAALLLLHRWNPARRTRGRATPRVGRLLGHILELLAA